MVLHGMESSAASGQINEIRLVVPSMNNLLPVPANLMVSPLSSPTLCPTDIERGYNSVLGFDLALLGVVKTAVENSDGTNKNPYGMANKTYIYSASYDNKWFIRSDEAGMYGLFQSYGEEGYSVARISKWLN